jgi:leucyl/phenylalanyl-tRNA--protein transferase
MQLRFTPEGIIEAYQHGVFPMADEHSAEIEWYLPDPRAILPLDGLHVSRSLAKQLRRNRFEIRVDFNFDGVMRACADRAEGSWISAEFMRVYGELNRRGIAHTVEAWRDGVLAGGVYGVAIGAAFMAESMFHRETDASKIALAALVDRLNRQGFTLLDVQFLTPHLQSLGAVEIPHALYACLLRAAVGRSCAFA